MKWGPRHAQCGLAVPCLGPRLRRMCQLPGGLPALLCAAHCPQMSIISELHSLRTEGRYWAESSCSTVHSGTVVSDGHVWWGFL